MDLDEQTRARLRALADASGVDLDEAARGRIARHVASEGPRALQRARRMRVAARIGGGCLVLGLGFAALLLGQRDAAPEAAAPPSHRAPDQIAVQPVQPRACERRAAVTASGVVQTGGARRFELGELGVVVAEQGSVVALEAGDPCRVRVRLERGRVMVHAADLGGGELRVTVPDGEVTVHGTVFAVTQREGALTVDVDEGRVSVAQAGRTPWMLDAGVRLKVPPAGSGATGPLASADRALLRQAVGLAPRAAVEGTAEPTVTAHDAARDEEGARVKRGEPGGIASAETLVAEADSAWRTGDLERARERYRRAGALGGATAEAAWLALARRELSIGRAAAARAALAGYRARFSRGKLAGEALGIDFRAAVQQPDRAAARRIARQLQQRYPRTPQAEAAARWLQEQPPQDGE